MYYESHILPGAQQDIRKLPSRELQESILRICIGNLGKNPRPYGYQSVKGQKDVYRVYSEDRNYRIIYSIQDDLRAVIILAVRRRREDTYKNIPVRSLSQKIKELRNLL